MATRTAAPKSKTTEVRSERYRIRFDRRAQAALCAQIAGACRLVWNLLLADCERRYRLARAYGQWTDFPPEHRPDLSTSYFTLGQRFTDIRSRPDAAWMRSFLRSPWGRRYAEMDLSWLRDLP
ncbi:MAG: helix-turn-helix domain-containing protein, partial [Caldilineaceae bacterium]|nr:helix-turn-helix domain-containing protein [Caldilineaceae bacterium]